MRLPEIDGYDYSELLAEDAFGWSFASSWRGDERRLIRVLKSQATNDWLLKQYFQALSDPSEPVPGAAPVYEFRLADTLNPAAYTMPFYGWKSRKSGKWQLTSLKHLARFLPPESGLGIVRNLARSLGHVHNSGIFHGGLKPGSLFLAADAEGNQEVRIGDFGQIFMGGLDYLRGGDLLFYASPEQLETGDFSDEMGFRWDVYAFGVLAFQLLTGHLPRLELLSRQCAQKPGALKNSAAIVYGELTQVTEHFITQLGREKPVEWPEDSGDSHDPALLSLVEKCLSYDPAARPESMVRVAEEVEAITGRGALPEEEEEEVQDRSTEIASEVSGDSPDQRVEARKSIPETAPIRATAATATTAGENEAVRESALKAVSEDSVTEEDSATKSETEMPPQPESVEGLGEFEFEDEGDWTASAPRPEPAVKPPRGTVIDGIFRGNRVLKWQVAAVASQIALLIVAGVALKYYLEYRSTRDELTVEAAELQENVEQQAAAYRRALTEKQVNSAQLRSKLDDVQASRSQLMGEAKLARQIVRQTQQNGDEFFEIVLENRDTDVPGFRKDRTDALIEAREHYERLIEVYGEAPDFIVSTANAYFYLGRIYQEAGDFGRALASFGEAERRYGALLDDESTVDVSFIRNLAVAKAALGELSMKNAEFAIARHYFTESSRFWAEVRSLSPPDALSSTVRIHRNSLEIVECELAINRLDAALDGARSIGNRMVDLMREHSENHLVVGAVARSFALSGRILEARGETDKARDAYIEAGDLYAKAVKLNAAADRYRLGLGNSFARLGLIANDMDKLEAAVEVLAEVVRQNPHEPEYQKTLADVYGVLARNQRDGGRSENAIALEREAISVLQPIVRENPDKIPSDVLYSYSQRLAHLAELLGDEGEFDESRAPLEEAIAMLEMISKENGAISSYQRALARARGLAGFACLQSGDETGAKEHLELARTSWESYIEGNPEDADAEQAVKWTSDQLERLQ